MVAPSPVVGRTRTHRSSPAGHPGTAMLAGWSRSRSWKRRPCRSRGPACASAGPNRCASASSSTPGRPTGLTDWLRRGDRRRRGSAARASCSCPRSRCRATRPTPCPRARRASGRGPRVRPDASPSPGAAARRRRGLRPHLGVPARRGRRRAGAEHRDRRRAGRRDRRHDEQAAHPGHGGLLRGPVLPRRAGRPGRPVPGARGRRRRGSGCRPAGTSGSPRSPAPTPWRARTSSSTRPRSAPSPTTRTSTPSRCGSRSSSATASPTGCSWSCRTAPAPRPGPTAPPGNTFYGSSFVSDPYGRVLVQAPRDEPCVLVADLDLAQREDWLDLFPFLRTRRPDTYAALVAPVDPDHPYGARRMRRWRMPHEGDRQDRLWLAWPSQGYTLGDTAEDAEKARRTWAAVANAAAEFEPVTVVAAPQDVEHRAALPRRRSRAAGARPRRRLDPRRRAHLRHRRATLGAVTWVFNGWGAAGLGDVGPRRHARARGGRVGRRRARRLRPRQRGRRHPRRRPRHRARHRDRPARPGPQPRAEPGRRRGRAGPHDRGHARDLAAARAHPRLRHLRHPRARRHRRHDRVAGRRAAARPARRRRIRTTP